MLSLTSCVMTELENFNVADFQYKNTSFSKCVHGTTVIMYQKRVRVLYIGQFTIANLILLPTD